MNIIKTYSEFLYELKAANLTGSWVLTKDYRYLTTVSNVIGGMLELEFTDSNNGQGAFVDYPLQDVYLLTPAQVAQINNHVHDFLFPYSLEDDQQVEAEKKIREMVKKHFSGGLDNLQEFDR